MIKGRQPYVYSSVNVDGVWRSDNRFVTNADYNKNILSVQYQNTAFTYDPNTNTVNYTGIWYKSVDTRIKSSTPDLNERGGFLIPNSPNPLAIYFPASIYGDDYVQGEGNKFTTAPPSEGDGFEIVITDYEP